MDFIRYIKRWPDSGWQLAGGFLLFAVVFLALVHLFVEPPAIHPDCIWCGKRYPRSGCFAVPWTINCQCSDPESDLKWESVVYFGSSYNRPYRKKTKEEMKEIERNKKTWWWRVCPGCRKISQW